jgi:acetoin:2,6-dichlorophenolindophenol oxidoreductase subunit beta
MAEAARQITFVRAINEALREEMHRDPSVFLMGIDLATGSFGKLLGLIDEFGPQRVRNTPISESAFAGAAIGAAATGMRPIAEIMFSNFFYVAMDQICNQAAKLRYMSGGQISLPLVYRTMYGALGGTAVQHSSAPYAQFMQVPGLKIALPATPYDAKGLLKTAIRDSDPVLFFESGRLAQSRGDVPEGEYLVPFGQARVHREGSDVTVVALGAMVRDALTAAEIVAREGISVEVLDPRTLVPLDGEAILESVAHTHRLVVVDEATPAASAASEIVALVAENGLDWLDAPARRVCAHNVPMPYGPAMEQFVVPDGARIVAAIREVAGRA